MVEKEVLEKSELERKALKARIRAENRKQWKLRKAKKVVNWILTDEQEKLLKEAERFYKQKIDLSYIVPRHRG